MDEPAPSYEEAVRQKDWVEFIVQYFDVREYATLCLVSKRFYAVFAIRLWKDPLATLRELRRDISTEPRWYINFIDHVGNGVRKSTASMVAVMDFRLLAMPMCDLLPGTLNGDLLSELPARFPNLRCILLDGLSGLDPSMLAKSRVLSRHSHASLEKLHLLSVTSCGVQLPSRFFVERWLEGLVYLDLSNTPGSLQSQIDQQSLTVLNLPQLRILKIRDKGLDYATASAVIREFRTRLWSLDVSSNNLNDSFLGDLTEFSLPTYSKVKLQTAGHFEAEGKIKSIGNQRGYPNGLYYFIEESAWSATFTYPERYLADTPIYRPENIDGDEATLKLQTRSNGLGPARGDSAAHMLQVLTGGHGEAIPDAPYVHHSPHLPSPQAGTTHLHLNDLVVSASAIEHLLRCSPGFIEHFECDGPICLTRQRTAVVNKAPWLSKSMSILGIPGAAYLFRPVISSNLRVLKVHHSLVTNTPTVSCHSTNILAKFWLAEQCLRERLDLAYPQTFVPDINPRLYSLTLCKIPRYSTGAVTERLINFLKLAARQEQMIDKVKATMPLRGPPVVQGLRHIQLEFEPVDGDELSSLGNDDELDAGALLSQGVEGFSFFSAWDTPSPSAKGKAKEKSLVASGGAETHGGASIPEKLNCAPFNQADGEHIDTTVKPADEAGQELTVPVWIGSGIIDPANPPAVNEYMRNLCDPAKAAGVIAATPCHVMAGVPTGSFIFHRAWDAMLLPAAQEIKPPTKAQMNGMKDVLEELKAYRREARLRHAELEARRHDRHEVFIGEHEHWKGKLVVTLPESRAHSSDYWR